MTRNGGSEIYVIEQQVKGRKMLSSMSIVTVFFGVAILALEIAVWVLNIQKVGPVSAAQIIATVAAFTTVIAGIALYVPSKANAFPRTLRRNFIISAVACLIATALLATALAMFGPFFWSLWAAANCRSGIGCRPDYGVAASVDQRPMVVYDINYVHEQNYHINIIAILKLTAILVESLVIGNTIVGLVLSVMNIMRRREHYQPAPVHEPPRVYYEKNAT